MALIEDLLVKPYACANFENISIIIWCYWDLLYIYLYAVYPMVWNDLEVYFR